MNGRLATPLTTPDTAAPAATCPKCGGLGFYYRTVSAAHPDFGNAFPCECTLQARRRHHMRHLRGLSQLDLFPKKSFLEFDRDPTHYDEKSCQSLRDASAQCEAFAGQPEGWLFLQGGYGCGKTHLAAAIAHELWRRDIPVIFLAVPELLNQLRATFSPKNETDFEQVFTLLSDVDVLVLDDLGFHQSATDWAKEKLFQLLNRRYVVRLPTVLTSNLMAWDFEARIQSRLADSGLVTHLAIEAPDYRTNGAVKTLSPFTTLNSLALHLDQRFDNFSLKEGGSDSDLLSHARNTAMAYAAHPHGWLVLAGNHGSGKTHLAAAVANAWKRACKSVLFAEFSDLKDFLVHTVRRDSDHAFDGIFRQLRKVPFLVLDNYDYRRLRSLDRSDSGSWSRDKIRQLLDYRFNACLATVITICPEARDFLEPWMEARIHNPQRSTYVTVMKTLPSRADAKESSVPKSGGIPASLPASERRGQQNEKDHAQSNPPSRL